MHKQTCISYLAAWLEIDQMIGGAYLKQVTQAVNARRNMYGQREEKTWSSEINPTRLTNYGLINPMPLDIVFFGQTVDTSGFIR